MLCQARLVSIVVAAAAALASPIQFLDLAGPDASINFGASDVTSLKLSGDTLHVSGSLEATIGSSGRFLESTATADILGELDSLSHLETWDAMTVRNAGGPAPELYDGHVDHNTATFADARAIWQYISLGVGGTGPPPQEASLLGNSGGSGNDNSTWNWPWPGASTGERPLLAAETGSVYPAPPSGFLLMETTPGKAMTAFRIRTGGNIRYIWASPSGADPEACELRPTTAWQTCFLKAGPSPGFPPDLNPFGVPLSVMVLGDADVFEQDGPMHVYDLQMRGTDFSAPPGGEYGASL